MIATLGQIKAPVVCSAARILPRSRHYRAGRDPRCTRQVTAMGAPPKGQPVRQPGEKSEKDKMIAGEPYLVRSD